MIHCLKLLALLQLLYWLVRFCFSPQLKSLPVYSFNRLCNRPQAYYPAAAMFGKGPVTQPVIGEGGGPFTGKGSVAPLCPDEGRVGKGNIGESGIKKDE